MNQNTNVVPGLGPRRVMYLLTFLLLACSCLCWSQSYPALVVGTTPDNAPPTLWLETDKESPLLFGGVMDPFSTSPFTTFHAISDVMRLPDTKVGLWSDAGGGDTIPPWWVGTLPGNDRLWVLTSIAVDPLDSIWAKKKKGVFEIGCYCSLPWSPDRKSVV